MTQTNSSAPKSHPIVVGFDFSELADRALEEALALAAQRKPAELHVVTVATPTGALLSLPGIGDVMAEDAAREAVRIRVGKIVDDYQARRGPVGVDRIAVYVLAGLSSAECGHLITAVAADVDADVIVVGTHGRRGLDRVLLGSVAQRVLHDATTSVLVVRPPDFVGGKKVPAIEPPLAPGQPHLRQFENRRTYHYVDRVSHWTDRTMPVG
jgi:nucleotide-binding universal stress UspA family protein